MTHLKGQVAVVTGSARGIGKAIALKLAAAGADIVVSDVLADEAEQTAGEIRELEVRAVSCTADVSRAEEAERLMKTAVDELGRLDILVNNAGITRDGLFIRMKDDDWDAVLSVNLRGTALCSRAAAKIMFKSRSGRIINVSSVIGLIGNAGQANYAASKAGVIGLTRSLSKELGPRGITVNAVAPGFIETAMTDKLADETKQAYVKNIPLGRFGTPDDVADTILYLATPAAAYVTGQVIAIDGGMTSH